MTESRSLQTWVSIGGWAFNVSQYDSHLLANLSSDFRMIQIRQIRKQRLVTCHPPQLIGKLLLHR